MLAIFTPARGDHVWASRPIDMRLIHWFSVVHALATLAIIYMLFFGALWLTVGVSITLFCLRHLSIRIGSHSYYSHRAFKTRTYRSQYAIATLFSGTFQNFLDIWAEFHAIHHAFSDSIRDPYSVVDGFGWAHMGWIPRAPYEVELQHLPELATNPVVQWQRRNYLKIAVIVAFFVPTAIIALGAGTYALLTEGVYAGLLALSRGFVEGVLIAGWFTLCLQYHFTWCVNSVAHTWGSARHGHKTARDNPPLGLVTAGEGSAHGRHHQAPTDYRIDPRWWAFDPGKWVIWLLSDECFRWFFLDKHAPFYDLQRVPQTVVEARVERRRTR